MLLSSILGIITFGQTALAVSKVIVYTPNTKISVPPGESIDYNIDVINKGEEVQNLDLRISGIPSSWTYSLTSGSYNIKQLSVLPDAKKQLSLNVDIPLKVNKGNYFLKVQVGNNELPLVINVSKQGSFKTEFTTEQANMQGHSKSTFTFSTKITNRTGEKQQYALQSKAPRGWKVTFKPNYKQATSVEVEPNSTKDINIDVIPPVQIKSGTYKIPIRAINNLTSAELEFEVVVEGNYEMAFTTPAGLMSSKLTAGEAKDIELIVRNTGSAELKDVKLSATKPSSWKVTFQPEEIENIAPGQSKTVTATLIADKKAIAGDYITNFTAKTPEVSEKLAFRISVKTPLIWGWIGVVIILASLGSIVFLFRKYGRR